LSYYELANLAGLVSPMNFKIIISEITKVLSLIENLSNFKTTSQSVVLTEEFFKISDAQQEEKIAKKTEAILSEYKPTSHALSLTTKPIQSSTRQPSPIKDNSQNVKDKRQESIISLLKKRHQLGIKEFAVNIKGCSEKTIQRELTELVAKGVLKREGERRWSVYSLQ
jgi:predicted HTH transcriptional regulator